ncbi:MAG: CocE/NonD family hydrolase [Gemmatimonadetes bacterium]|nr:CocE/NonD family hydrolase [Gemmatimonadota bacterium]
MGEPHTADVIVARDVMVPMRDGVRLATDLYFPGEVANRRTGPFPAILERTPYNKNGGSAAASFFARHGYMAAVQDCRGRYGSEGAFFPFRDDPEDGYDTIEWIADHPSCNGKVGMHGCSYDAWVQFHAATQNPPSLATMIPFEGPINAYHYSMREGGALHLGLLNWAVRMSATSHEAQADPSIAEAVTSMTADGQNFLEWASRIPWRRGQTPLAAAPQYEDAVFQLYFENNDYSEFWRQPGFAMDEYFDSFPDMPILWMVGWFDWYPRTIIDGFRKMVSMGRGNQHLLVGPWTHGNCEPSCGDVHFGPEGGLHFHKDFLHLYLHWFNRWLKEDSTVDVGRSVRMFRMGGGDGSRDRGGLLQHGGKWFSVDAWPPEGSRATPYYIHENGILSPEAPLEEDASTTYSYDPRNSVSSNGRCIIPYGPMKEGWFKGMGPRDQIEIETLPGHGIPGMPIASRPDVLVFQSAPLIADLSIAGNIGGVLWISSDAPDTDFFLKLLDVYPPSRDDPTGYAFPVSEGILRARYRDSFERPRPMEPGNVYRIEIDMQPAANLFKAGHRIRLDICSSNFPNYDINRNTSDPDDRDWRIARNTVYHDGGRASYVELPVWAP